MTRGVGRQVLARLLATLVFTGVVVLAGCGGSTSGSDGGESVPPFDRPGCEVVGGKLAGQILGTDRIESAGTGFDSDGSLGSGVTECEIDGKGSAQIWIRIRQPSASDLRDIRQGGPLLPDDPCRQRHLIAQDSPITGGSCVEKIDTRRITDLRSISGSYYVAVAITRDLPSKGRDHEKALEVAKNVYAHIK